ncbi:CAP domain-containing protein [Streptomyces sp. NBC_00094]|uniref:CAP domain-containing protein n=1 Tax=Streptomyces sp. NBC_00094 TaxID=2903620 RepID=UPI00224F364C|nr:CAP domain-containing protein [Streptomyces sp. NBC_00094]MCX5388908.1 CAP domain-containing protein [Streptomyces sp. NBC_00094]
MRHHDHPGHPDEPERVDHLDLVGHREQPDHPARDGGRHRKSPGARRRAPRRPGFRTAVSVAGAVAVVLTVAAGVYVASPAPAAGPSTVAATAAAAAPAPAGSASAGSTSAGSTSAGSTSVPAGQRREVVAAPPAPATKAGSQPESVSAPDAKPESVSAPAPAPAPAPEKQTERRTGETTDTDAAAGKGSEFVQEVVALANAERRKAGCGPLRSEGHLRTAAQGHADDMAERDYYEHDSPEGRDAGDRITGAGYTWSTWGENIHRGPKTPARAMEDWMDSPGHRENILNCSFKDIGVGVTLTANGPWWVQNFGAKR